METIKSIKCLKGVFFTIALFLAFISVHSQVQTQIVGDSILMHGNNGTSEFNLLNGTKNINGFLFNKGNGRTEFRRGLIQLTDTSCLIGADTLLIDYQIGLQNVFFVSKKYIGAGGAIITGLTKASITSGNQSYTSQLAKSKPGSMIFSYPDPFSARNAALDAINSGKIMVATIVVLSGSAYTVGSDNPNQNGNLNYSANSNVISDIGFSQSNSTIIASLLQNKINYYFEQGAQLHYINSVFQLWMSYNSDMADSTWESGVYGHGYFKQYYGQNQGFISGWCYIDNANAKFSFISDYLELQYWQGFNIGAIHDFDINVKKIVAGYINILSVTFNRDGKDKIIHGSFICDDLIYGQGKIKNSANDFWAAFSIGRSDALSDTSSSTKSIYIRLGNADITVGCPEYDAFFETNVIANANINLVIDNLFQTSSTVPWVNRNASLIGSTFTQMSNVLMNVNINNAVTEYPLFGMLKNSYASPLRLSRFNFHCGLHRKLLSSIVSDDWAKRNINIQNDYLSAIVSAKLVISGTYINESNSEVVAMDYSNLSKLTEFKGYYQTTAPGKHVMIFNGYQDKRIAITDATLINDGSVPSIALKGSQNGYSTIGGIPLNSSRTIYIKNVHATAPVDLNVITVGDSLVVLPDLKSYY